RLSRDWSSDVCSSDLAAGGGLLADQQDRERRGQRLRQDREVGTANPAAEDRPPQGERDDPRYRDDGHERDQRGAERFPLPRHLRSEERRVGKDARSGW